MRSNIWVMIVVVLLAGSMSANAVPLVWNLQGVTFDDGGTATGSFVYDANTSTYSAINIQTTGNLSFTYTTSGLIGGGPFALAVTTGSFVGAGFLQLIAVSGLTDAGGTIAIGQQNGLAPWETTYVMGALGGIMLDYNSPPFRSITAGYVTSVPEPATFKLLGFGLLGVGFMWRRKVS
jgi:hypothetical protein